MKNIFVGLVVMSLIGAAVSSPGATITVTSLADSGAGTLRQAIASASPGDTIDFATTGTIVLTSAELAINANLNIVGPGQTMLTISGNGARRVFNISAVTVNISGLTIANGHVNDAPGGGIYNSGTLTLDHCLLTNNIVNESSGGQIVGGGIFNSGGTLTISHCTLWQNYAVSQALHNSPAAGAGLYNNGGLVAVNSSTFSLNLVQTIGAISASGGGLFNNSGTVSINNCTFAANSARAQTPGGTALGGAIYNSGTLSLSNSTVAGNSITFYAGGSSDGGGVYHGTGIATVRNTIVANNGVGSNAGVSSSDVRGAITSQGFNLISRTNGSTGWITGGTGQDLTGSTNAPLDPKLGLLQDNGGPSFTMALLPGSSALDVGNSGGVNTDQRGLPRPSDNPAFPNASGGDGSDIGAYEVELNLTVNTVGGGVVVKNPDQAGYAYNSTATLTAIPAPGWSFDFWSGNASGSANPVNVLMNSDKNITANFTVIPCAAAPLPSGVVSWWRAEGDASDAEANNPGTLTGGATFAAGKVGQAFSFDGVGDAGIVVSSPSVDFGAAQSFTFEAWVRIDGSSSFGADAFLDKRGTGGAGYLWEVDSPPFTAQRHIEFTASDGVIHLTVKTGPIVDANFHHVAVVLDRNASLLRIYLDGSLQDAASIAPLGGLVNNSRLFIGHQTLDYPTGAQPFHGLIDELTLYNRALPASEILAIYIAGIAGKCQSVCAAVPSGLVSWWPGAGNANDIIGTNNGSLQNGATFAAGKVGTAFSFDGVDDHVDFGTSAGNFGTSDLTIEFWIKSTSARNDEAILGKRLVCGADSFWNLFLRPDGKIRLEYEQSVGNNFLLFDSTQSVNNGVFRHVAWVRQGTTSTLYIDGMASGSGATPSVASLSNVANLYAGRNPCIAPGGANYFTGLLDEVSFYNRALPPAEIQALYAAGSAGKCATPLYITSIGKSGNDVNLSWLAQKGMGYRAQYKTNLAATAPWTDVSGDVTATGSTASKTDAAAGSAVQRFYQVMMLQ